MALTENEALELIRTGLSSGSIKLLGSQGNTDNAEKFAKADAKYMLTVLEELQKAMPRA
jgi:hypothetical protein